MEWYSFLHQASGGEFSYSAFPKEQRTHRLLEIGLQHRIVYVGSHESREDAEGRGREAVLDIGSQLCAQCPSGLEPRVLREKLDLRSGLLNDGKRFNEPLELDVCVKELDPERPHTHSVFLTCLEPDFSLGVYALKKIDSSKYPPKVIANYAKVQEAFGLDKNRIVGSGEFQYKHHKPILKIIGGSRSYGGLPSPVALYVGREIAKSLHKETRFLEINVETNPVKSTLKLWQLLGYYYFPKDGWGTPKNVRVEAA